MPRVSIAMPLYNAEKYVRETIDSLLTQTYEDFEIIIIDDASTDYSAGVVQEINDSRVKMTCNERNMGIAFTRNKAIEMCTGEYIALMDDDDVAPDYRLEKEVRYLDENIDIDIVGGHCRFINEQGEIIRNKQWNVFQNPAYIKAYLLFGDAIPNGTAMMRRSFLIENDIKYQDNMQGAEDYRLWVECSLKGRIANIDEVLLYWRMGHENETSRVREQRFEARRQALFEIRKYALEQTGFQLSSEEIDLVNRIFDEDGSVADNQELRLLYMILKKISKQAKALGLENEKEITTMCRKRFGEKVGKAFYLWE